MVDKDALVVASRSRGGVVKGESLSNRDFPIILRKKSISSPYLAWTAEIAVIIADITTLAIDCSREGPIGKLNSK